MLDRISEIDNRTIELEGSERAINNALTFYLDRGYECVSIKDMIYPDKNTKIVLLQWVGKQK